MFGKPWQISNPLSLKSPGLIVTISLDLYSSLDRFSHANCSKLLLSHVKQASSRCLLSFCIQSCLGKCWTGTGCSWVHVQDSSPVAVWVTERGCHLVHAAPTLTFMLSFQPQHSHLVIQQLLGHLDANSKSAATVRAGIVEVLSEAAVIAASGSVGKWINLSSPSISSPFYCGGNGEEVPEVWPGLWRVPRCELVLGDPVRSIQGCWGSVLCHFRAQNCNTRAHVQRPKPRGLNAMPAFAFVTGSKGIFRGLL